MLLRARAPMRIDFAGGFTDLIPFASIKKGAVLNAAINLYVYVTLQTDGKSQSIETDFDFSPLLTAALCRMSIKDRVDLLMRSEAPPGGGLGLSGAMGVGIIGIMSQYVKKGLANYEIADIANEIERGIGVCCGKQDQYASVLGGINFMEFCGEKVKVEEIKLSKSIQYELEKSLCLCYTGRTHHAGEILKNVVDAYISGNEETMDALENLRQITVEMRRSLLTGDLQWFGKLMDENWQNQKRLHPSISNAQIDNLFEIAYSSGAIGGKACGAGGGGCLIFYCAPDMEDIVQKRLKEAGASVLPFKVDFNGLQMWTIN